MLKLVFYIFLSISSVLASTLPKELTFIQKFKQPGTLSAKDLNFKNYRSVAKTLLSNPTHYDYYDELSMQIQEFCFMTEFATNKEAENCEKLTTILDDIRYVLEDAQVEESLTNDREELLFETFFPDEDNLSLNVQDYMNNYAKSLGVSDPNELHDGLILQDRYEYTLKGFLHYDGIEQGSIEFDINEIHCFIKEIDKLEVAPQLSHALLYILDTLLVGESLPLDQQVEVYCTLLAYYQFRERETGMPLPATFFLYMPEVNGELKCF